MNTHKVIEAVDIHQIASLPLFAQVEPQHVEKVVAYARQMTCRKGTFILRNGEANSRIFIVLSGWLGVRRNNASGEEAVLDILEKNHVFPSFHLISQQINSMDVVALSDCHIFALPYAQIAELFQNSRNFAQNLLSFAEVSHSRMRDHIEQLTLRSAEQRVGAFLLRLRLDNKNNDTVFDLPFDKAIIASYLGIKPETFSRALQNLKANGVKVDRHTITIPDAHALCTYCDQRLARHCAHANTQECAQPLSDTLSTTTDPLV